MITVATMGGVQYDGNPLTRSLEGLPTIVSAQDVSAGAGGDVATSAANRLNAHYEQVQNDGNGVLSTPVVPTVNVSNQQASSGGGIIDTITHPLQAAQDVLNRGLFGVLGVIVLALGLWFTISE